MGLAVTLNAALGTPTYCWLNYSLSCDPIEINLLVHLQAKKQSIEYRTFMGLASTDALSDSPQHLLTTVLLYWWPNSEAQKTQDHRHTYTLRKWQFTEA